MKIKGKSLRFNYVLSVAINLISYIFPLLTYPYVTRTLGAEGIGKVSFAETVASYFILFSTLGIPTYGIRACAAVRDKNEELAKVTKELIVISLFMTAVLLCIFLGAIFTIPQFALRRRLLLINCITIILTPFGVNWFFNAIENFTYITFRTFLVKVVTLAATFIFVKGIDDYYLYALILVLSTAGAYIFNFSYMNKLIDLKSVEKLELKRHIKPILMLFATTAAATIYSNVDVTMLGLISGDSQVGFYNVAHKLRQVILSLVSTMGTVLIPRLSYYIKNNKKSEFGSLITKAIYYIFFLSIPLTLFFFLAAEESVLLIAGHGYKESIIVFVCILPTIIFCAFSNMTGLQILVPMEKENVLFKSLLIGALVDIFLNLIFIVQLKAVGVAIATAIAEFFVLVYQVCYFRRNKMGVIGKVHLNKMVMADAVAFAATFIASRWVLEEDTLVIFVLKAFIFWGTYIVILMMLKDEFTMSIVEPLYRKLIRRKR